jgi:transcription initiation factor TFIIIB Brf1 subunit/transcription initiation factor TFIIB
LATSSIDGLLPKSPNVGGIYLNCRFTNLKINQKEIAQRKGITEVILRTSYKELLAILNLISC